MKRHLVICVTVILCIPVINLVSSEMCLTKVIGGVNQLAGPIFADHTVINYVRLNQIPITALEDTKRNLNISYQHSSHGSQISNGLEDINAFKEANGAPLGLYSFNEVWSWEQDYIVGALNIDEYFGMTASDLGYPDRTSWAQDTRNYLQNPENSKVNVIMWAWCGQVASATPADIELYINLMTQLETDFPDVYFIYMTGHVDGTGEEGNLNQRNEQIRQHCRDNNKILYDFADIESYDPDGNYYGDKYVTDACNYDANGNGYTEEVWNGDIPAPEGSDKNWALDWQNSHINETDWFKSGRDATDCTHTYSLNTNQKAYAVWWLFARLAGWGGNADNSDSGQTGISSSGFNINNSDNSNTDRSSTLISDVPAVGVLFIIAGISTIFLFRRRWK